MGTLVPPCILFYARGGLISSWVGFCGDLTILGMGGLVLIFSCVTGSLFLSGD